MAHAIPLKKIRGTVDPFSLILPLSLGYRSPGSIYACNLIFFGGSLLMKDVGEDKKLHQYRCILRKMIFTN